VEAPLVIRRRPTLAAALICLALSLVFVGQGLLPGRTLSNSDSFWFKTPWGYAKPAALQRPSNPEFDDAPAVLHPFARFTKDNLPDVPLWNPSIMTGRPFEADAQSAIFSPFSVPAYLLPFLTALGWIAVLKLWVASFGTFLLARALGMRFAGAMLAAVIYGFCLWEVTWLSYPHASVWALIPLLLVAVDRAVRRPDTRGAWPLAALTGLQLLCGHPESSFHAEVAAVVFGALRAYGLRAGWRRPLLAFAGATAFGFALAAVAVLPFLELLSRSSDIHQRAGTAQENHAPLKDALGIFLPDWYGRPTQTPLRLFLLARAWYGGALALMCAAAALLIRPTRGRVATALLGAACMMVVLGVPPVFQIVTHLPIFSGGHNGRLAILALLCLALLAGWGLDDLGPTASGGVCPARPRRRAVWAAAAIFALPILYAILRGRTALDAVGKGLKTAWGFATPPADEAIIHAAAVWEWALPAAAGLVLIALLVRRRGRPELLAGLVVLVAFLDLARAGMGYNPAIPRDFATQPDTPAIRLARAAAPERVVATGDIPQDALPMNHDLAEPRGYDLPVERRYDRLWRRYLSPEFATQSGPYPQGIPLSLPKVDPTRLRLLDVLGTRYVMQPLSDPAIHVPGLRLVHDGPDARLYRSDATQPRAVVVGAQQPVASGEAALHAIAAPGFDLRRTVVTEKPVSGFPLGKAPAAGSARIVPGDDPDKLVVDVAVQREGMLVVSDAWDPGWKATVDGKDAKVERVNYVMRGVRVGPGAHRVEFRYEPWSFTAGWIVSLAALLVLVGALVWWRRRT
jgi:hypothetical protein